VTAIDSHSHQKPHGDHAHGSDPHGHDAHGGHGHSEYPFLAHHFDTPGQQFDSAKLGMWVFLATEILFFGALFAMYTLMRAKEPEVFSFASNYLDTIMGGINTAVLILSSLTMAMAVHFAQRSKKVPLVACLFLTFLGACGFLVIKYFEYTHKFEVNLKWGPSFYQPVMEGGRPVGAPEVPLIPEGMAAAPAAAAPAVAVNPLIGKPLPAESSAIKKAAPGPQGLAGDAAPLMAGQTGSESMAGHDGHGKAMTPEEHEHMMKAHVYDAELPVNTHRFFGIYYCMTGLHGIHVVVGMFLIGWITIRAMRGDFNSKYYTPVDMVGLYWHIVDLIWIFLFPLFYLIH
jgi:cytochrome c oxidase subunit III